MTGILLVLLCLSPAYAEGPTDVAQIGETKYDSLEKAFNEAVADDTITMLADYDLSNKITVDKKVTLDLNGSDIKYFSTGNAFFVKNTGDLTLEDFSTEADGMIYKKGDASSIIKCEGKFTLNNGTIKTGTDTVWGLFVGLNSDVTINGGEIISVWGDGNGGAVASNGLDPYNTLTINGGTITGGDIAIYLPSAGTTVINGTTTKITGSEQAIEIRVGDLTINDGTLTATAARNEGGVVFGSGKTGSYTGVIVAGNPASSYKGNINLAITGGTFINEAGDAIALLNEYTGDDQKIDASVSGGTFTGGLYVYEVTDSKAITFGITGGTYSVDPTAYVKLGYQAVEDKDTNKYDVLKEYRITYEGLLEDDVNPESNLRTITTADLPLTLTDASRVDYDFNGWFSDEALTTKVTQITVAENTTLWAKFTEVPQEIKDLEDLINDERTPEQIQKVVAALLALNDDILKEQMNNSSVLENIATLEELLDAGLEPSAESDDLDDVKIIGAILSNNGAGVTVTVKKEIADGESGITADPVPAGAWVFRVHMDHELQAPIFIKMPIPAGFDTDNVVLIHYSDDGTSKIEQITDFKIEGGYISFVVTHLSKFVVKESTPTPSKGGSGGSGTGSAKVVDGNTTYVPPVIDGGDGDGSGTGSASEPAEDVKKPTTPTTPKDEGSSSTLKWILVIGAVIVIIAVAFFLYQRNKKN